MGLHTYATDVDGGIAALRQLLDRVELNCLLVQGEVDLFHSAAKASGGCGVIIALHA